MIFAVAEKERRIKTMEFTEYMKIKRRMTQSSEDCTCSLDCHVCPLGLYENGYSCNCRRLELIYPEKAESIVKKWAEEHPQKTIIQDFYEKYPNVMINTDGTPPMCVLSIGYKGIDNCNHGSCVDCWNQPLPE